MGLSKAQEAKRYARGKRKPKHRTSTERVRRHRERRRAEEVSEVTEEQVQRRVEEFPYTVRNELRRAIRHGCLRPLEFWVDGRGELHNLRDPGNVPDEVLMDERQAHAEDSGEWPEVEDVTVTSGDDLPFINEYDRRRYDAVADAVAATGESLGIELVKQ